MTLYCILESCWRVDGKCSHRPRPPQQLFKAMDIVNNFTNHFPIFMYIKTSHAYLKVIQCLSISQ